jgi:acylphosphatase
LKTVWLRVTGRVQGVGYRAWAIETAANLALHGWVRNRADGSVEMRVSGTDDAVAAMIEACGRGPRGALVGEIRAADDEDEGSCGFVVRPIE